MKLAITAIGILAQTCEDLNRSLPGWVWNEKTGVWQEATPESLVARQTAINATVGAVLDAIPFPIPMGTLGSLDRAKVEVAIQKISAAMEDYVLATTVRQ